MLRTAVIPFHRGGEPLPRLHCRSLPLRLRQLLRVRDFGSSAPSEVEPGPAVREWRQDVIGRDVAAVAGPIHVPPVRGSQRDDVPRPIPSIVGFLEVLEDDAARGALDDLSLVRLPLQSRPELFAFMVSISRLAADAGTALR